MAKEKKELGKQEKRMGTAYIVDAGEERVAENVIRNSIRKERVSSLRCILNSTLSNERELHLTSGGDSVQGHRADEQGLGVFFRYTNCPVK